MKKYLLALVSLLLLFWLFYFGFTYLTTNLTAVLANFHSNLATYLRNAGSGTGWLLVGVSFLYGVIHSIGPGHGKFVLSSYSLTHNPKFKRLVVLGLTISLLQGVTAVVVAWLALEIFATGITAVISNINNNLVLVSGLMLASLSFFWLTKGMGRIYRMVNELRANGVNASDVNSGDVNASEKSPVQGSQQNSANQQQHSHFCSHHHGSSSGSHHSNSCRQHHSSCCEHHGQEAVGLVTDSVSDLASDPSKGMQGKSQQEPEPTHQHDHKHKCRHATKSKPEHKYEPETKCESEPKCDHKHEGDHEHECRYEHEVGVDADVTTGSEQVQQGELVTTSKLQHSHDHRCGCAVHARQVVKWQQHHCCQHHHSDHLHSKQLEQQHGLQQAEQACQQEQQHSDHCSNHQQHDHDANCGCGNHLDWDKFNQTETLSEKLLMATSIILRPCTGAIFVLIFAANFEIWWWGVLSAMVMALGTGIGLIFTVRIVTWIKDLGFANFGKQATPQSLLFMQAAYVLLALALFLVALATINLGLNGEDGNRLYVRANNIEALQLVTPEDASQGSSLGGSDPFASDASENSLESENSSQTENPENLPEQSPEPAPEQDQKDPQTSPQQPSNNPLIKPRS